jgi:pilus assembly protein CpaE
MSPKHRILVIDDEPIYHKMVAHAIKSLGCELDFANGGEQGLRAIQMNNPDLIITDVVMPDMTGYEITQKIRQNRRFAQTPILILTSQTDLGDRLKAFEAGADDYMSKPFEPSELIARVGVLLRRKEALESTTVSPSITQAGMAQTIAVHSLRGGVGCSSTAVNTAVALWEIWNRSTILIDAVLTAGQVALMFNTPLRRTWGDVAHLNANEVDYDALQSIIIKHEAGPHLIAGPSTPAVAEMISADTLLSALDILKSHYEYIVIDTPHNFSPISIHMLDSSDIILSMLAPEMASIRAAVAALDSYNKLGYNTDKVQMVLNNTFEKGGLRKNQIEDALEVMLTASLPFDPDTFTRAINVGKPFMSSDSRSPASLTIETIAYEFSKDTHKNVPPVNPTNNWNRVSKRFK